MIPLIDATTPLRARAKIVGAGTPAKLKEMAARGIAPGVKPAELLGDRLALAGRRGERSARPRRKMPAAPPSR
ncbi:MAG: hypothetical protein R3F14_29580 [Polyangiaceae bacterium]